MMPLSARDVADHLPLIRAIAHRVARGLPQHVTIDELVNAGTVGLYEAAERFDPTRAGTFDRFAAFRIRGAMIDSLRAMDWLSRRDRAQVRDGLMDDVSLRDLDGERIEDPHAPRPSAPLEARERSARMARALAALPARQRMVLAYYYLEELTLREIASMLSVTESRVCQLHRAALATLRASLADEHDVA